MHVVVYMRRQKPVLYALCWRLGEGQWGCPSDTPRVLFGLVAAPNTSKEMAWLANAGKSILDIVLRFVSSVCTRARGKGDNWSANLGANFGFRNPHSEHGASQGCKGPDDCHLSHRLMQDPLLYLSSLATHSSFLAVRKKQYWGRDIFLETSGIHNPVILFLGRYLTAVGLLQSSCCTKIVKSVLFWPYRSSATLGFRTEERTIDFLKSYFNGARNQSPYWDCGQSSETLREIERQRNETEAERGEWKQHIPPPISQFYRLTPASLPPGAGTGEAQRPQEYSATREREIESSQWISSIQQIQSQWHVRSGQNMKPTWRTIPKDELISITLNTDRPIIEFLGFCVIVYTPLDLVTSCKHRFFPPMLKRSGYFC